MQKKSLGPTENYVGDILTPQFDNRLTRRFSWMNMHYPHFKAMSVQNEIKRNIFQIK